MAQISGTVRSLNGDYRIASITSPISAANPGPEASTGSPKFRSREGQITTTCHFQIGRHLRFQDQGRQLRLIGGRQKQ
jgi:hypothetical protein